MAGMAGSKVRSELVSVDQTCGSIAWLAAVRCRFEGQTVWAPETTAFLSCDRGLAAIDPMVN